MIRLFQFTQISIVLFTLAVTRNCWNLYRTVCRYGSIPARLRRRYEIDLYLVTGLAVVSGVMVIVSIVTYAVVSE